MTKADLITTVRSSNRAFVETLLVLLSLGLVTAGSATFLPTGKCDRAHKAKDSQYVCHLPFEALAVVDNNKCS